MVYMMLFFKSLYTGIQVQERNGDFNKNLSDTSFNNVLDDMFLVSSARLLASILFLVKLELSLNELAAKREESET